MASDRLVPTMARLPMRLLSGRSAAALVVAALIAPLFLSLPNTSSSEPVPGVGPDMTRNLTWNFDDPADFTATDAEVGAGHGSLAWSTYSFDQDSEAEYSSGIMQYNLDLASKPGSVLIDVNNETVYSLKLQPGMEGLDSFVREDSPDSNYGTVTNLILDGQLGKQQRPILWFNLTSVPENAAIVEAGLWLYLRAGKEFPVAYTAYAISHYWHEFEVTWNSYKMGLPWAYPGGDFEAFPFYRGTFENTNGWYKVDMSKLADLWATGRLDDYGVILVPDATGSESSKTFVSSDEMTRQTERPMLILNYTISDKEGIYESKEIGPGRNTTFTTASWMIGAHSALTDEFAGTSLFERWSWTNDPEESTGHWDVGSSYSGWLHVEGEGNTFLWGTNIGANYLHENATGHFDARTYVSTSFALNSMGAGLLMLDDNSNWFATLLTGTGSGAKISAIMTEAGVSTTLGETPWPGQTNAHLRMIVNESSITALYGSDGQAWNSLVSHNCTMPPSTAVQIGLCVYSGGSLAIPLANFDFFRVEPLVDLSSALVSIRLGNSSVPGDVTWGPWSDVLTSPHDIGMDAKYLQYRVTLNTAMEWCSPSFDGFYCGNQRYPTTGEIQTADQTVEYLSRWLTITCVEELNGGTVNYSYSTDHGASWSPLQTGVSNSISDTAPNMTLKMSLWTPDTLSSPLVDTIVAQYAVAASSFHVNAPGEVVAGEAFSITVEAKDESDVTIEHWTGAVTLSAMDEDGVSPASSVLSETVAYISAGGATVVWDESYTFAETIRIMASAEDVYGLSNPITVLPGDVDHVSITPGSEEVPEYSQIVFTAAAEDGYYNPIEGMNYVWSADATIGTLNTTVGRFVTLETGPGRQEGHLSVSAGDSGYSLFLRVVPPMYPPEILEGIEEQIRPEDYGSWSINISSIVSDFEDSWRDMRWYIADEWLVTVSGENRTGDMDVDLTTKPDVFGSNTLKLVIVDSDGMTASTEFVVTVTPVNDPPSIDHIAPLVVTYDIVYEFDFRNHIFDVDNDVNDLDLYVDHTSAPYVTVKFLEIEFLYPFALNGTQQFVTVRVSDNVYESSTTLIVTVSSDKVPFSRALPAATLDQGQTLTNVLNLDDYFDDPDDSVLLFSSSSDYVDVTIYPNHTIDLASPIYWWGVENVIFSASDEHGARCEEMMEVTVRHVNQPPSIGDVPDLVVRYDLRYDFDLSPYISDLDNAIDTLSIAADSSYIAVIGSTISLLFPQSLNGQSLTVTLSVSDGDLSDSCSITVKVSSNLPPTSAGLPTHEFLEDGEIPYPVGKSLERLFTDPDGVVDDLSFFAFTCTANVNAMARPNDLGEWFVWFNTTDDWNGACRLTVRAVDGDGGLAERTITLTVIPQPDPPKLKALEPITMQAGTQKMLDLAQYASDPDSESQTFAFVATCDEGRYVEVRGSVLILSFTEHFLDERAGPKTAVVEVSVIDSDGFITTGLLSVTVTRPPGSTLHGEQWYYVGMILIGGLSLGLFMVAVGMRRRPFVVKDMMLIHNDGFLISRYARPKEGEIDEQVLSSMLTAVLNFVDDSMAVGQNALKTFGFRDYQVIVERGNGVFAAIAYEGDLPEGIDETLDGFLATVEKVYKKKLEHWSGDIETDFAGVELLIQSFVKDHSSKRKVRGESAWKTRATDRTVQPRHVLIPSDQEEKEAEAQERKARFTRKGRSKDDKKGSDDGPSGHSDDKQSP